MRIHGLLFSTFILTTGFASAQSQSQAALPDAPNPAATPSVFTRNYLVPHDSRNEIPRINPAAQPPRQLGKVNLVARNNSVCYTVRAYNFPKDISGDMTKPTSSTTCEAAKGGALKRSTVQIVR